MTSVVGSLPESADDAIVLIFAEHYPAMLTRAIYLTHDRQHAEDLVQEALIRVWRSWGSFDKESPGIRGWLMTILRNLAIDRTRAWKRQPKVYQMEDWEDGITVIESNAVEHIYDAIEDRTEIVDLLEGLSPDERAALIEIYILDQSFPQAARYLGVPQGTVKSRVFYAIQKIREKKLNTPRTATQGAAANE